MQFQDFWIIMLVPIVILWVYLVKRKRITSSIRYSSTDFFVKKKSVRLLLAENMVLVRAVAALLIVIALMRPQSPVEESKIETEGIDIVLTVDISGSMLAEDFTLNNKRANRLAAVKEVVQEFIQGRTNDRIGLVAFASRAYTVCPLTLDYGWLMKNIERLEIGMIEDGTAIGSGLSSALNRLKDTKAKGKVVILLTDGRNNAGKISPLTAAEAGQSLGVKVYTIGAGTKGLAPFPMKDFFGNTVYQPIQVDIDEDTLMQIASETNARYFRATDTASLKDVYKEIDRLEKTPIEEKGYLEYKEWFPYFLIPALLLLLGEIILGNTLLRRLP